ncbi:MAG: DUF4340 domain-containing protein [Flavobacteriales bacterium]|nr:DUF4340 domain-containing protein [Flavobacteriales bacterium]
MKSNRILIAILIVLVAVTVVIVTRQDASTIDDIEGAKSDFAVQDTAAISKIFIADRKGVQVTLTRKNNIWMVDGSYPARPDNVKLLLKTFYRIKVKSPVPKAAIENVKKNIITEGIKVEIYQGEDQPAKVYYVGSPTLDDQGTYMYLETDGVKSSVPFIMHIPGFYGYLTTRFFTEPSQWRDAVVFKYVPEQIKGIKVNYYETPEQSFIIENQNQQFVLKNYADGSVLNEVDTAKLAQYVSLYQNIYYEMIDIESKPEKIDSVIHATPYFEIEVNDFLGSSNKIVAYHMPNYRQIQDKNEQLYLYDVDRMYAYLNDELFVFIQFATFDQITLPKSYFLSTEQ